jgi:predicted PurR-regulated permease PerM
VTGQPRKAPAKRAAARAVSKATHAAEDAADEVVLAAEAAARATEAAAIAADLDLPELLPDETGKFGRLGPPVNRRTPFFIGFDAAIGVALAYGLIEAMVSVRQVLVLIVVALFLAIGLEPVVKVLERNRVRRGFSVLIVLVLLFGGVGGIVAAATPPIARQAHQLSTQLPNDLEKLRNNKTLRDLDNRYHFVETLKKHADPTLGVKAVGGVIGVGKELLGAVFSFVTVLVLLTYFIANFNAVRDTGLRLVPLSRRPRFALIADEVLARVGGYVLGNIATSLLAGVLVLILFLILGVPYSGALAILVAIFDLIPLVGATLAAIVCCLVAFFHSVPAGITAVIFFVVYQQLENHVVVPRVMKKTVSVSPLVTIIATLIGGSLLGIVGALLAIPIAAALQLILGEVVFPRQQKS